jgi:predicted Zn-dependent protease
MPCYDDGGERPSHHPMVALVFFEEHDQELKDALLESLEQFFDWLNGELPVQPRVLVWNASNPENIPDNNQDIVFFPVIEQANGNIILGVTGTGFYDTSLPRFVFSYGSWKGRGLLSTYRFRKETKNRVLLLDRLRKQIIKTLAMACGLGSCSNPECVVSYHRWVEDLDRNRYVCNTCRSALIRALSIFLKQYDRGDDYRGYA